MRTSTKAEKIYGKHRNKESNNYNEGINRRSDDIEHISQLEDKIGEITRSEQQKLNRIKKKKIRIVLVLLPGHQGICSWLGVTGVNQL